MLFSRGRGLLQLWGQSEPPAAGIFLFFPEEKILFIVNPRGFPKLSLSGRACFLSLNTVRRACPAEHIDLMLSIFSFAKLQEGWLWTSVQIIFF